MMNQRIEKLELENSNSTETFDYQNLRKNSVFKTEASAVFQASDCLLEN